MKSSWVRFAWMVVGALSIAVGAQVAIPMAPVPTTLQTLAVVAVALWRGPGVGVGASALYLAAAIVGLPVLSGAQAHGGLDFFAQPSAGYVVGFLPAAAVAGWWARSGGWVRLFVAGLVAHAVVLAVGVTVLATWIGTVAAVEKGLLPFLLGAAAKSAAAAVFVAVASRAPRRPRRS